MGWLDRARSWLVRGERMTVADFPNALLNAPVVAGVAVSETTALNFSAYYNGVDIISSQIATLPRILYRRLPDDERERVTGTPAAKVLAEPNPMMTDVVFWQTLMAHVLTWGNGYAEIEFDRAMRPIALWPITPNKMQPVVVGGGRLAYRYNGQDLIAAEDVLHVAGLGFDGIKGYSVVTMARQALALGIAAERFGGSFFGNGAWPGFMIEHPGKISKEAAARLEKSWNDLRRGPDRAFSTAVLEEGMKANKLGIPPDDAQFLQTREFQVVEIARWLNLPPHKLKHKVGERPGGNIEASQIEFLTDTLRPWLVRIEQECKRKLIIPAQRETLYVEHLVDAILRMDSVSRASSYKVYNAMGVLSAEQIAKKENLPKPKPSPVPPSAPPSTAPPPPTSRTLSADRANLVETAGRFVRREATAARRASKRGPAAFQAWVEEFYRDEVVVLRGFLLPAIRLSMACRGVEGSPEAVSRHVAAAYVARSREELLSLQAQGLEQQAEKLVIGWETERGLDLAELILAMDPSELREAVGAPVVNVTVNVPEAQPPGVTINVPPALPTPVRVEVAPAAVTVNPRIDIPATTVNVAAPVVKNSIQIPPPIPLKVERDLNGNISGVSPAK